MKKKILNRTIMSIGIIGLMWSCELNDFTSVTELEEQTQEEEYLGLDTINTTNEFNVPQFNETKAFPTAEGFGRYTKGGRDGKVVYVTSLADKGTGTLRDALENVTEPRIVMFKVSGIIELTENIRIQDPYITVAGQSAPGTGITLKNAGLTIMTHDVILRHLKIRPGDSSEGNDPDDRDAITVKNRMNCHNLVLDHLSLTWGIDENLSFRSETRNATVQNCIIAEGLSNSLHYEGEHSKGFLMLANIDNISIINNLFAHNRGRNPLVSSNSRNIHVVNNLIFGWGGGRSGWATHTQLFLDDAPIENAIISKNVYRKDSESNDIPIYAERHFRRLTEGTSFFIDENYMDEDGTLVALKGRINDFQTNPDYFNWFLLDDAPSGWKDNYSGIKHISKVDEYVLANAGARKPILDSVDKRIINDARTGSGKIIDSPSEVGGYPAQNTNNGPIDSDNDGMPDTWETERGLNPDSANDAFEFTLSTHYANLEIYLSKLAGDF